MKTLKWGMKRLLCYCGIHWEGKIGLGMYGDAACCAICGKDAYGLKILYPTN